MGDIHVKSLQLHYSLRKFSIKQPCSTISRPSNWQADQIKKSDITQY